MYRFNMFTTKANEALNSAIKLAQNYGHNYVGTEHILLGLLTEGSVENALNNEGVTLDKPIEKGTYTLIINISTYSIDSNSQMNGAQVKSTLTVE